MHCFFGILTLFAAVVAVSVVEAGYIALPTDNAEKQAGSFIDDVKNSAIDHIKNVITGQDNESWFEKNKVIILAVSIPVGGILVLSLLIFCCYKCCCSPQPIVVYQPLPTPQSHMVITTGVQGPGVYG